MGCPQRISLSLFVFFLRYTVNSRYLELSRDQPIYSRVQHIVILCKLIRMGPIVLVETSRVRLIEYRNTSIEHPPPPPPPHLKSKSLINALILNAPPINDPIKRGGLFESW